jgi:hypothetical protein
MADIEKIAEDLSNLSARNLSFGDGVVLRGEAGWSGRSAKVRVGSCFGGTSRNQWTCGLRSYVRSGQNGILNYLLTNKYKLRGDNV